MGIQEELDKAIVAHAAWKTKFRSFMSGETTLDPTVVEKCNVCDFGKWLEGGGKGALGVSYAEIHQAHAHFHTVAASVVRSKLTGQTAAAEASLAMSGEFTKASANLALLVVGAKKKAA